MLLEIQNNIIRKVTCCLFIIIILLSSFSYKKVDAVFVVDDVALLYLTGAIITGLAVGGIVANDFTITGNQVDSMIDSLNNAGDEVIKGINNLGNSIKNGADLVVSQALASGVSIYAVLNAMSETLFVHPDITEYDGTGFVYGINNGEFLVLGYSNAIVNAYPVPFTSEIIDNKAVFTCLAHPTNTIYPSANQSILSYRIFNVETGYLVDEGWKYPSSIYFNGDTRYISWDLPENYDSFLNKFTEDALNIGLSDSISIPASVPDVVGSSIDSFINSDTDDLIISLPTDYALSDDLIVATPDTVADPSSIPSDAAETGTISDLIDLITGEQTEELDTSKLQNINALIFDKFPFSIPFDVYHFFQLLNADPQAPYFSIPFDLSGLGGETFYLDIDFSPYESAGNFIRNLNYISFIIFLMYSTKNLIWK